MSDGVFPLWSAADWQAYQQLLNAGLREDGLFWCRAASEGDAADMLLDSLPPLSLRLRLRVRCWHYLRRAGVVA